VTSIRKCSYGDVAGFLAVDKTNKLLVVSFRGSRSLSTWLANIDFGLDDSTGICSGCEVHGGFWDSWKTVADDLTAKIKAAQTTYPGHTLIVTGHSFGAAIASVGGTVLRNAGFDPQVVSIMFLKFLIKYTYDTIVLLRLPTTGQ